MSYFGTRHVSNSLGFAMGWMYWYSLGILVPYEITAGAVVIGYCMTSLLFNTELGHIGLSALKALDSLLANF